jgi:hypothetical protein
VNTIGPFDGGLLVGGGLTMIGGVSFSRIALWNGQAWTPFGDGLPGIPGTHVMFDGALHVGGSGSSMPGRLRKWDGQTWSELGDGVFQPSPLNPANNSAFVRALTVLNGELYVGGTFETAGGLPASNIARWDGESWSPLGGGMDGMVLALKSFDDGLGDAQVGKGSSFRHSDS